ncbi:hypothetical protein KDW58_33570, partial [Burkholderia vietnamiensis]|nr:hypothetical protein [Burkholderia vietnamiensis]
MPVTQKVGRRCNAGQGPDRKGIVPSKIPASHRALIGALRASDTLHAVDELPQRQCQLEGGAVEWRDEKEYLAVSRFPFSIRSHQLRGALVLPLQP